MLEFMQQRDIRGVACFILACFKVCPMCPTSRQSLWSL